MFNLNPTRRTYRGQVWSSCGVLWLGLLQGAPAMAQAVAYPAPQNVVNLQAEASTEVAQDLLTLVMAATREGADAAQVQSQLRQALDAALTEARKAAKAGQLDVRTGGFSVSPRYAAKPGGGNLISGWLGRAELVLEGRDSAAIAALAGRISGLTVQHMGFSLSRSARDKAEAELAAQAISAFKQRAEKYAQAFGFASYSVREVAVGGGGSNPAPQLMRMTTRAMSAERDESQPMEAGKSVVSVTVSGSIQMSPR